MENLVLFTPVVESGRGKVAVSRKVKSNQLDNTNSLNNKYNNRSDMFNRFTLFI